MGKIWSNYKCMTWVKRTWNRSWVSGKLTCGVYCDTLLKAQLELCSEYQGDDNMSNQYFHWLNLASHGRMRGQRTGLNTCIPALRRQEDCEFQASLDYISRPSLRTNSKNTCKTTPKRLASLYFLLQHCSFKFLLASFVAGLLQEPPAIPWLNTSSIFLSIWQSLLPKLLH